MVPVMNADREVTGSVLCACGKLYDVRWVRLDSHGGVRMTGLPAECVCGAPTLELERDAKYSLSMAQRESLFKIEGCDEGPQHSSHDINESPSYRSAMQDSGRGRLLR